MASQSGRTADLTNEDLVAMFGDEPRAVRLEAGQVLFKNGDLGGSMYIVQSGTLRIRSGSVIYEDVGPGGYGRRDGHRRNEYATKRDGLCPDACRTRRS